MQRVARFLIVGAIATAIQFCVLTLGVEWFGWRAAWASTAGYVISAVANYLMNYRFTFRSQAAHSGAALRFACVLAVALVLNAVLMWLLTEPARWPYLVAQVLTTLCVLVWNFRAHAAWSFAPAGAARP